MFLSFLLGIGVGIVVSSYTDLKTIACMVLQRVKTPNSLNKISRNIYELKYYYLGKEYTKFLNIRKGPHRLVKAVDKGGFDITPQIRSYLGPNEDGHCIHIPITPNLLGHQSVEVYTLDGDHFIFEENDEISLKKYI